MYALFLETAACREIDGYVQNNPEYDAEDLKRRCYSNAVDQGKNDNWWVGKCLMDDSHKKYSIDMLMLWSDTPEGHEFWCNISMDEID